MWIICDIGVGMVMTSVLRDDYQVARRGHDKRKHFEPRIKM